MIQKPVVNHERGRFEVVVQSELIPRGADRQPHFSKGVETTARDARVA